jgi:hypothetical protein
MKYNETTRGIREPHLCQASVSRSELDRLPHNDIVEKHCPIRRRTPVIVIVGLQASLSHPRLDTQNKLTLDEVADV